ncbi:hypothetical protein [Thermaerobacillus caldiproteolyticus]|uniref:hypothetical protein n=1 Tax=Thermaerobacillus caldiproteolyticus TaxID=247480 RepID=UPI0018F1D23F|nr:hypothetical protein [Anoxybacillus caldiproteolyticus]
MKKRTIVLLLLLLAVIVYGTIQIGAFMNIGFGRGYHNMPMADIPRHYGPFVKHHHFAFHYGPRDGFMEPSGWMLFGIIPILFQLAMIVIGWIMWKTASRSRAWKWTGLALMGVGVVALLPKLLLIPLGLIAAYMIYKKTKYETVNEDLSALAIPNVNQRHFLDEWEKNIRKEEQ